jgi:cysteine desulfuration protein SufE
MRFDRLISRFQAADRNTRLEALLDYSKKLPPLPERYQAELAAGAAKIPECQTPVYLWVAPEGGTLHFHAEVPRESPTVRGYVSLLLRNLDGATPAEVAEVPDDLLERLKLVETLGMMRVQGLTAILRRVKGLAALESRERNTES